MFPHDRIWVKNFVKIPRKCCCVSVSTSSQQEAHDFRLPIICNANLDRLVKIVSLSLSIKFLFSHFFSLFNKHLMRKYINISCLRNVYPQIL